MAPFDASSDDVIKTSTSVRITVSELYNMVYNQRLTDGQIGRKYGLSSKTIRNWRRKCQYDTLFKTGTMDLPLSEVRRLIEEGRKDEEIASLLNTTKTCVISFRRRHEINVNTNWPIDRRTMIDYVVAEYTNIDISAIFGVTVQEVSVLQAELGVRGFRGTKTYTKFGTQDIDSVEVRLEISLEDYARRILGKRLKIDPKHGFMVDDRPIHVMRLVALVGYRPTSDKYDSRYTQRKVVQTIADDVCRLAWEYILEAVVRL